MNSKIMAQPVIPPEQLTNHFVGNAMAIIQVVMEGHGVLNDLGRAMELLGEYRELRRSR